jgi:hypothetical protein
MASLMVPESCGNRGYKEGASLGPVGAGFPIGKGGKHVWVKINGVNRLVVKAHAHIHAGRNGNP